MPVIKIHSLSFLQGVKIHLIKYEFLLSLEGIKTDENAEGADPRTNGLRVLASLWYCSSDFKGRLGPVRLAGGSMKADTARGLAALRSVPVVRFEFVPAHGKQVRKPCGSHRYPCN